MLNSNSHHYFSFTSIYDEVVRCLTATTNVSIFGLYPALSHRTKTCPLEHEGAGPAYDYYSAIVLSHKKGSRVML